MGFHEQRVPVSEHIYTKYPSLIKVDVLPQRLKDPSVIRRLLACILSALKSNGSHGVHCQVNVNAEDVIDVYMKLGFFDVTELVEKPPTNSVFLGRVM